MRIRILSALCIVYIIVLLVLLVYIKSKPAKTANFGDSGMSTPNNGSWIIKAMDPDSAIFQVNEGDSMILVFHLKCTAERTFEYHSKDREIIFSSSFFEHEHDKKNTFDNIENINVINQ